MNICPCESYFCWYNNYMRRKKTNNVQAQNALTDTKYKKRFGRKERKKTIIIVLLVIIAIIGSGILISAQKNKIEEKKYKESLGDIKNDNTESIYDNDGNKKKINADTQVIIIGRSTLIKKGDVEILVDANTDITGELKNYVEGDLEYVIATNSFDDCIVGLPAVYNTFEVKNTICVKSTNSETYKALKKSAGNIQKASNQSFNVDADLVVSIRNGIGGSKRGKTAFVIVSEDDYSFIVSGPTNKKNTSALQGNINDPYCLITPTTDTSIISKDFVNGLEIREIAFQNNESLSAELKQIIKDSSIDIVSTNENGKIIYTITKNGVEQSVEKESD